MRHGKAERRRGLDVYDQLELGRPPDWEVRRFRAIKDLGSVGAERVRDGDKITAITDQAPSFGEMSQPVNRWNAMA